MIYIARSGDQKQRAFSAYISTRGGVYSYLGRVMPIECGRLAGRGVARVRRDGRSHQTLVARYEEVSGGLESTMRHG